MSMQIEKLESKKTTKFCALCGISDGSVTEWTSVSCFSYSDLYTRPPMDTSEWAENVAQRSIDHPCHFSSTFNPPALSSAASLLPSVPRPWPFPFPLSR